MPPARRWPATSRWSTSVPGKFGRQLVKGDMKYEDYGTIEAHVRLVGGPTVVVPLTLLPAP